MSKQRALVSTLTASAAGFAIWVASEGGLHTEAYVPTKGDVPTIGAGSTRYEDGTPVKLGDKITRARAETLARNLMREDEQRLIAALPGVDLTQGEFDVYLDFVGQFGIGNFRQSSMRRHLLAGRYGSACDALLQYRFQAGRDCKLPKNWGPQGCKGVWTRQVKRHQRCMEAQP